MLHKTNRLARSKDIAAAFARGRTFFNPLFSIKFLPTEKGKRFTVVVSTKVYKNAVSRNRLKRILRESLRKNLVLFKNGDYVIAAKPKARGVNESDLLFSFEEVLKKIRLSRQ
jgi:ribonuclease P protein component